MISIVKKWNLCKSCILQHRSCEISTPVHIFYGLAYILCQALHIFQARNLCRSLEISIKLLQQYCATSMTKSQLFYIEFANLSHDQPGLTFPMNSSAFPPIENARLWLIQNKNIPSVKCYFISHGNRNFVNEINMSYNLCLHDPTWAGTLGF